MDCKRKNMTFEEACEILEICPKHLYEDVKKAYSISYKDGLNTIINGKDFLFWSKELLEISKKGLEKRSFLNKNKNNEIVYLKNIDNILLNNLTKAQQPLKEINVSI